MAYDEEFWPPAPVVDITLIHPDSERQLVVKAKIDTGADTTVIPEWASAQLRIEHRRFVPTRSFDGHVSRRPVCFPTIRLAEVKISDIRCIVIDRKTVFLGRNVLNHFVVTVDGPQQRLNIVPGA